jgi:hypothetical protein
MIPSDADRLEKIINVSFSWLLRFFAIHSIREEPQVLVSETLEVAAVGFVKLIDVQVGAACSVAYYGLRFTRNFAEEELQLSL